MKKSRFTEEQIAYALKQVELGMSAGTPLLSRVMTVKVPRLTKLVQAPRRGVAWSARQDCHAVRWILTTQRQHAPAGHALTF